MNLQKRLASSILKCSPKRIWINPEKMGEIKEAITREDVKGLVQAGIIEKAPAQGISRGRIKKNALQKRKGRRKNAGSRKGTHHARVGQKDEWVNKIRKQRALINLLKKKEMLTTERAKELYHKAKGGFFRSRGHLKLYINEHKMVKK